MISNAAKPNEIRDMENEKTKGRWNGDRYERIRSSVDCVRPSSRPAEPGRDQQEKDEENDEETRMAQSDCCAHWSGH